MKRPPNWLLIVLLSFIPLLMVLGNAVLIPGMPTMQSTMHVTKFQVSLLITLFSVPAGLVIPFAGFLSDRIGRKWVIVPSILLFGTGGVVAGFASWWLSHPYWVVLVGRVIQGIGAAGTAPIAMAFMGDLFQGNLRSKALGINEAGNAFGKVVSPIIGAAVALLAWFAVFFIFPVLCLPLAAAIWWMVPEASKKKTEQQSISSYLKSLGKIAQREGRWLSVAYLCGATALFTLFGVLFYLSDLLESKYNIDGIIKGLILAIPLLVLSTTSYITGVVIQKKKQRMKWFLVVGFAILATSVLCATWLATNAWMLIALMSVGAIGTGLVLPSLNMLITSAVDQTNRGSVTSFYGSVRFLGVAFGPPVFTWLLGVSTAAMFVTVASLAALCGLLAWLLIRPEANAQDQQAAQQGVRPMASRHKARS
ncbi:MFS transporter [Alicyclobacillus contaminans]|uniref:MFS transporter n=1 Tax=Alicyclobacillus contaminans TaxID=392016 RepID=UPI00041BFE56|nr:MFS transporter [Alicyclobacillus contaminans]